MTDKLTAELAFWQEELLRYESWFAGWLELYGSRYVDNGKHPDAITAWIKEYQEPLYMRELRLRKHELMGLDVLEIGPGPVSGIGIFIGANVWAIDPLADEYVNIGFTSFVSPPIMAGRAEQLPFDDDTFDAVVAVNSLDHVDDITQTASEILRVLRPDGKMAFAVDHHPPRKCEPVELTDALMRLLFPGIVKVLQVGERALWRNFR